MKKTFLLFISAVLLFSIFSTCCYAEEYDLKTLSDDALISLFSRVKAEMSSRNLPLSEKYTLREGKHIVGEDILPGTYKITCIETAGETLGSMYSSMGNIYGALEGSSNGLGAMMGSLGGMMGNVINTTVEILGDYGTVLKSFEMKGGESTYITLSEKTAIQITNGSCTLEAE